MGATQRNEVTFDGRLMSRDMAARGWIKKDLARRAGTTAMSVGRFLSGKSQSARMAAKLSKALGYSVRRYMVPDRQAVAS